VSLDFLSDPFTLLAQAATAVGVLWGVFDLRVIRTARRDLRVLSLHAVLLRQLRAQALTLKAVILLEERKHFRSFDGRNIGRAGIAEVIW
jgi:hypothetical protein